MITISDIMCFNGGLHWAYVALFLAMLPVITLRRYGGKFSFGGCQVAARKK